MDQAKATLPPPDPALRDEALALIEQSKNERDLWVADELRQQALRLWDKAHQARREALYRRERQ